MIPQDSLVSETEKGFEQYFPPDFNLYINKVFTPVFIYQFIVVLRLDIVATAFRTWSEKRPWQSSKADLERPAGTLPTLAPSTDPPSYPLQHPLLSSPDPPAFGHYP